MAILSVFDKVMNFSLKTSNVKNTTSGFFYRFSEFEVTTGDSKHMNRCRNKLKITPKSQAK